MANMLNSQGIIPLDITVVEDVHNSIVLSDIISSPSLFSFKELHGQTNFGVSRSAFWFKITIPPPKKSQRAILEISYPLLDIVDIYTRNKNNWILLQVGDTRPATNREIDHYTFLKTIDLVTGHAQHIFIKAKTNGPTIVPIKLWEEASFHVHDRNNFILMGLYFGLLFAIIIYNLFLFLSVHDRSYLYYVGYLSFLVLFMLTLAGLIAYYFLPDSPIITSRLPFVSLCLALLFGFKFSTIINNTKGFAPGLVKAFNYFSFLLAFTVFIGLFIGVRFLSLVTPYLAILALILYVYAMIVGVRAAYKPSYFVGFTFLVVIPGGVFYALKPFGLFGNSGLLDHAFQLSVAIDSLLLSFALAYRIRYTQVLLEQERRKMAEACTDFSRQLIAIRDNELRLLASDLHDGLGQNLLVIKNKLLRALKTEQPTEKNVRSAQHFLQSIIDDIRHLSHSLHPHVLDHLGLRDAIEAILEDVFGEENIEVCSSIDDIRLPEHSPLALHLYRIVQEGVKNIHIHAEAKKINVEIRKSEKKIYLLMEDFPSQVKQTWLEQIDYSKSFGLSSIRERVEALAGQCMFSHNSLGGFKVNIILPCETGHEEK